jgi:hypothetical protein
MEFNILFRVNCKVIQVLTVNVAFQTDTAHIVSKKFYCIIAIPGEGKREIQL